MGIDTARLYAAANPFGVIGPINAQTTDAWLPPNCHVYGAMSGSTLPVLPYPAGRHRSWTDYNAPGTGRSVDDPDRAKLLAAMEALERYCSMVHDPRSWRLGSGRKWGDRALDLTRVPRCSAAELRHPACPIRTPDPDADIRWVSALRLDTQSEVLVPAVMVHLGVDLIPGENFWLPISTGCAAHESIPAATVNAICEVIERDAIALTWLQRLSLPPLEDSCLSAATTELVHWCQTRGITTYLFDATTDLHVPTVYCLQTASHDQRAAQLVGCSTDFEVSAAAHRAVLEAMAARSAVHHHTSPRRYADYTDIMDGAALLARRARRPAFRFLLDGVRDRAPSRPVSPAADTVAQRYRFLVDTLSSKNMPAYGVDLSTREATALGISVVRVVIPDLQPLSLTPLAQYRAHPRLFTAPPAMGFPARSMSELNPWPQPVA
ncbi:YcaO-like family protein [Fodinicola acaciae]|uniref:YcaO-like family protein n=1 Tax=Fodinicola acaciae TaxID=2681555 RepID=UPI0013D2F0D0|nr:YcaO-like family protein [Fodinicola acaciae]